VGSHPICYGRNRAITGVALAALAAFVAGLALESVSLLILGAVCVIVGGCLRLRHRGIPPYGAAPTLRPVVYMQPALQPIVYHAPPPAPVYPLYDTRVGVGDHSTVFTPPPPAYVPVNPYPPAYPPPSAPVPPPAYVPPPPSAPPVFTPPPPYPGGTNRIVLGDGTVPQQAALRPNDRIPIKR
jgi:hypothetical protein